MKYKIVDVKGTYFLEQNYNILVGTIVDTSGIIDENGFLIGSLSFLKPTKMYNSFSKKVEFYTGFSTGSKHIKVVECV